ncbi:MAG: histidine ammonia-lyase [Bacteroidales bacterium]|nr:histidine ammonia-lyase [Bacteroidales bacterium]MDD4293069.1 histidine ammonia-lyase [Bacteroidales bacterium]MDD4491693.1 histidine ammonia-lyase [Bacteroidales bacterium]
MEYFHLSLKSHTLEDLLPIFNESTKIKLSEELFDRIKNCRDYLDNKMQNHKEPIYGITTGFGSLCNVTVSVDELSKLQRNLVVSHACGVGAEVPQIIVRLMMFLKIKSLSYGYSGVRTETVQRLVDMFNNGVYPVVYEQGSLGASGDLAPLANMSLPLLGLGDVNFNGKKYAAAEVNDKFGWKPLTLASKEGLALLNGTQFMLAYSVWNLFRAKKLSSLADKIAAISLDAFDGRVEPFTPGVHAIRPHKGQIDTAAAMRELLNGSELIKREKAHVQDPYSFRCVPQVHGATKDALDYIERAFVTELNSATDNPTILPEEDMIVSAGNFHGQPLAIPLDVLSIALAELGSISERRTYQLISGKRGLPSFLVAKPGLNSGFMIPQYAQASVVSQNKQLATPACVDTIDSSQGQEDHVSMGANAATKCCRVVENVEKILAIELMNAAQALEFRRPQKSSPALEEFVSRYRKIVPFISEDEVMYTHIHNSVNFIREQYYI